MVRKYIKYVLYSLVLGQSAITASEAPTANMSRLGSLVETSVYNYKYFQKITKKENLSPAIVGTVGFSTYLWFYHNRKYPETFQHINNTTPLTVKKETPVSVSQPKGILLGSGIIRATLTPINDHQKR